MYSSNPIPRYLGAFAIGNATGFSKFVKGFIANEFFAMKIQKKGAKRKFKYTIANFFRFILVLLLMAGFSLGSFSSIIAIIGGCYAYFNGFLHFFNHEQDLYSHLLPINKAMGKPAGLSFADSGWFSSGGTHGFPTSRVARILTLFFSDVSFPSLQDWVQYYQYQLFL